MFRLHTLFIVGAGASCEVGLPSGTALKATIASLLNISFDFSNRQKSGDFDIVGALKEHARQLQDDKRGNISPFLTSARQISRAMPQAASIDAYIDAHRGDTRLELCGKLAIAKSIVEAERASKLYTDIREGSPGIIDFSAIDNSWYNAFWRLLADGIARSETGNIFKYISIITFNYDRCIEHYLFHGLQNYYGLNHKEAGELLKILQIVHPYGSVGPLPWQESSVPKVPFGEFEHGASLKLAAQEIKTFTERIRDEKTLGAIRGMVESAEKVVFLGFGFHKQNLELITPERQSKAKVVFGTTYGMSESDRAVVANEILRVFGSEPQRVAVHLRHNMKCSELFNEFSRILTAA